MELEKLNHWLTLLANLGVIAGIVFLAVELRQNNEMMRAQTRSQLAEEVTELFTANMNDQAYAEVLLRGNKGEELSEIEQYQYTRHRSAWLWYWNNVAYQYQIGLYDENEFTRQISVIRGDIDERPGMKAHWCDSRSTASSALVKAIESESYGEYC